MLLTLSAKSFHNKLGRARSKDALLEVPAYAHDHLGLQGLNVQTRYLKGWEIPDIDRLRDMADKAACPCLLVTEEIEHPLSATDEGKVAKSLERINTVLRVASRLGCSSVAIRLDGASGEAAAERAAERLKTIVTRAERLELNLLLASGPGLTATPDDLTSLIRKVGGFRIGSFPDFETAAQSGDSEGYLRGLTPYASVVSGSFSEIAESGEHGAFDLRECFETVLSVGFEGTLSLEYRGPGDPEEHLLRAREMVESLIEASQKK